MKTTINKHDVVAVRAELNLGLFELIALMSERGWSASLTYPSLKDRGFAAFEKRDPWHQRPKLAMSCKWGYALEATDEDVVLDTLRRSAELCLRIYEAFPEHLPGHPNIHGEIKADPIANHVRFCDTRYRDFEARKNAQQLRVGYSAYSGTWQFEGHNRRSHLTNDEIASLTLDLKGVSRAIGGQQAFSA